MEDKQGIHLVFSPTFIKFPHKNLSRGKLEIFQQSELAKIGAIVKLFSDKTAPSHHQRLIRLQV